jgi:PAS domain S-box-containing protein
VQAWSIRGRFVNELAVTSEMVASNAAVAAMFKDEERANDILSGLKSIPNIRRVRLVLNDGTRLAQFGSDQGLGDLNHNLDMSPTPHTFIGGTRVVIAQPITRDGIRHGTLYLDADFAAPYLELLRQYGLTIAMVASALLVFTYLVSSHMQRLISAPILRLTATAQHIAERKDYTLRVASTSKDEVGVLTEAFNQMLGQIFIQDTALRAAQKELEEHLATLQHEIAERLRAERAQRQLIAVNEATPDFVGTASASGEALYLNPAARRMLGLPADAPLAALNIRDFHPHWVQKILIGQGIPAAIQHGSWSAETALRHTDGHEIHVSQVIIAHKNAAGEVENLSTVMRDISEHKAAETALSESQERLLKASRMAGMAEVATSVLHNVGNVLNSVNVSGDLLTERVRSSRLTALVKTAAMVNEHRSNLASFVADDPRGQRLAELIAGITQALVNEHKMFTTELTNITSNISHIKEIVSMQQTYSRVGGLVEPVDVGDLVETALKMSAESFSRHQVQITKKLEAVPPVPVDKHKVLQILVNLLTNAKQAVGATNSDDKHVTISVTQSGQSVGISIRDNGIGIPSDNLTRIFSHGFTTKKEGHGFGLHSSALAATELGGALRVHSDGIGQGATFTLELRTQPPGRKLSTLAPSYAVDI